MKNGLLVYSTNRENNLFNIGDYIQSIAARQFFDNQIDIFVNRENLHCDFEQDIKIILNGWFMHEGKNWPPHDKVHPLFISFHINKLVYQFFSNEKSLNYFKKHQPIGCRDQSTVDFLKCYGIDAYFSGCLTLTLGETYKNKGNGKDIIFVDPCTDKDVNLKTVLKSFKNLVFNVSKMVKLNKKMGSKLSIRALFQASYFYNTYSQLFSDDVLLNAKYIQHLLNDDFKNDEAKFLFAETLLNQYSSAKYIVTSRIHCALPCVAMNTPVLYIHNTNSSIVSTCRLDGILDLLNVIEYQPGKLNFEKFFNEKLTNHSTFLNPNKHIDIVKNLVETAKNFVLK